MTALVSFERVFEVLDLPSHDPGEAGRRRAARAGAARWSSTTSRSPTRGPTRSRWPRWRPSPAPSRATPARCSRDITLRRRARPDGRAGRPVRAPARPRSPTWSRGSTTPTPGSVRVGGHDVRDVTLQSLEDVVGYVTQDAHMFHDTIRANLLYARPDATDDEIWAALEAAQIAPPGPQPARRARHRRRRPRLPALRRRAAAARDRPAAAQGAGDRGARRGDRPPRQRVRGRRPARARRRPRGPHLAGDRAPALDGAQRRPDPGRSTTAGSCRRGTHAELLAAGRPVRRPLPHPVRRGRRRRPSSRYARVDPWISS